MVSIEALKARLSKVAVVGLGYVGLPLLVALARKFDVLGFDISERRVAELSAGNDRTGEIANVELAATVASFSANPKLLVHAGVIIIAVPTPIDGYRNPDVRPITEASVTVGSHMAKGCVVVYESTVWPGLTEELCVPILERASGLTCGLDFQIGYSPERINPGDKKHTLSTMVKVVAGKTTECADFLAEFYSEVVEAGVFRAYDIKTAEAAKVIENTQRDLNIALMNELAMLFGRMGIDTLDVLEAASTKWNFLPFRPGMVGGHCIGVDPYYLTFKAESLGFHPQVILAGRAINDSIAKYVAEAAVKRLIYRGLAVKGARAGILGLTFKENVSDLRNTKVVDLVRELKDYGVEVLVHDALADPEEAREEYGLSLVALDGLRNLDVLILTVAHDAYRALSMTELKTWFVRPCQGLMMDVKGFFDRDEAASLGLELWRL